MDVFLTGGTGHVGSGVLAALLADGHTVHALARSDASAQKLEQAGATVVRGELTDTDVIAAAAAAADGTIHTGSPGDETSAAVDSGVATAALAAGKPYVHTGGVWIFGSGTALTEDGPRNPPALTAWRPDVEKIVTEGGGRIVAPGVVYGHGLGIPNLLTSAPHPDGALLYAGTGDEHWTTIHADDLGRLYVAVLTAAEPGAYVFGVNGENPTVHAMTEAASHGAGLDGRVAPEPADQSAERLGVMYEPLLLDQQATGATARALGWAPREVSILDDLATGSYVRA